MDACAQKTLESVTHRTLHSQGFSRSSSQASLVLTDLLLRYFTLLASTCAKYAEHAGRTGLTPRDAISALEELGVNVDDLDEYTRSEAQELKRYAIHTSRRWDELRALKAHLADGLRQDRDDSIPLIFAPLHNNAAVLDSDDDDEEDTEEKHMHVDEIEDSWEIVPSPEPEAAPKDILPPLPLSPISNPSSPARKRPRTAKWRPPSDVPDFLPPFPNDDERSPSPVSALPPPQIPQSQPPPLRIEKISEPIPQLMTPTSASDYITQVSYSQSSLAATAEWHLPAPAPPHLQSSQRFSQRLPTPQTEPSLLTAYHHILTHPPSSAPSSSANPSRHKVAMVLLSLSQVNSRWESPDTLYASMAPGAPRVGAIGPTFPLPIDVRRPGKDGEGEGTLPLPPAMPRPVSNTERITSLVGQQTSRIPELARHVLPSTVYSRTTKLHHPGVLLRGDKKLTYGPGVNAPWNTTSTPPSTLSNDALLNGKPKEDSSSIEKEKQTLQDARLFVTWDYEPKWFGDELVLGRKGRVGSGITLGMGNVPGRTRRE